jgi:transcription-repair coupling factor (superfamily II helicase)
MLIPNSYVSETAERLALYRKLDDIKDETNSTKFTTEVTDRFGPIPQQVQELMEAIRLRWLGQQAGPGEDGAEEGYAHRHLHRGPEASVLRERHLHGGTTVSSHASAKRALRLSVVEHEAGERGVGGCVAEA